MEKKRYVLIWEITVEAHDEDEAIDIGAVIVADNAYDPDIVRYDADQTKIDPCTEEDCSYCEDEDEDEE